MKFYLTAAIPYVNAKPHMGHALEFIQGDVIARYHREKGDEVRYITGADENSLKIVQAAEKEGLTPQELSDRYAVKFQEFLKQFHISIDAFQRSSAPDHFATAQEMWKKCDEAGDIYEKSYKGLYCVSCEAFYTLGELSPAKECLYHPGKPVDEVEEKNYFFKLSRYQDTLLKAIENDEYKITPQARKNEVVGFIKKGLEDFSISRSVKRARGWGVPVPGDESQIMYVWFDALNVYRTAAAGMWPARLHVIGKDILRFHAVYWPAMLLSAQIALPKELFVHGFITANGQKMSKSLGNVVDPIEIAQKYGVEALRYYLLREILSDDDGDFSEEKFKARYNADLANGLGNFASRVLTLSEKLNPWILPKSVYASVTDQVVITEDKDTGHAIHAVQAAIGHHIDARKLHEAVTEIWRLVSYGDKMVNATKPWELKDEDPKKREALGQLLLLLAGIARELRPFMPETAQAIESCLIRKDGAIVEVHKPAKPLFARLS